MPKKVQVDNNGLDAVYATKIYAHHKPRRSPLPVNPKSVLDTLAADYSKHARGANGARLRVTFSLFLSAMAVRLQHPDSYVILIHHFKELGDAKST